MGRDDQPVRPDRPEPAGSTPVTGTGRRRRALAVGAVLALAVGAGVTVALSNGGDGAAPGPVAAAPSPSGQRATPGGPPTQVVRVAPEPAGSGDGSSWADAAGLEDLPDLVETVQDGGEVWLRADAGPYRVERSLDLSSGGAEGRPVVVRGVNEDGTPAQAQLVSDRTSPYDVDGKVGSEVFELGRGADHLAFRDLSFSDVGSAFTVAGDVTGLEVTGARAKNVRRFLDNTKDEGEPSATINGLVLRRIDVAGFSKGVVRLRYDTNDVLIEDVVGDSQQQDGDDFAMGVALQGKVRGVVIRRVRMDNAKDSLGEYWNGDGFATEEDVSDVLFENTSASGNTDAGYDVKSTRTRLVDAVAKDNKRNYRLWATDTVAQRSQGVAPRKRGGNGGVAQVWLAEGASATLEQCTLRNSGGLVFELGDRATLRMQGGRISRAPEGRLQKVEGAAQVELEGVVQQ